MNIWEAIGLHVHILPPVLLLNIVVEWLTLLLHIWEVLGLNLGLETGYPD
jgi:hypothetical protein